MDIQKKARVNQKKDKSKEKIAKEDLEYLIRLVWPFKTKKLKIK